MSNLWMMAAAAVVGAAVGYGISEYVGPATGVPNAHRYSFRVNLVDPNNGGLFQQPTEIDVPTSWEDKKHDAEQTNPPNLTGATMHTIQLFLGAPQPPHEGHPDDGPGDWGPHCHTWALINGVYRQVHCGY